LVQFRSKNECTCGGAYRDGFVEWLDKNDFLE